MRAGKEKTERLSQIQRCSEMEIDNLNQAAKELVRKCEGIERRSKKNGSMQDMDKTHLDKWKIRRPRGKYAQGDVYKQGGDGYDM